MFSIWVTNCCNLKCKYCYVENNKGKKVFDNNKVKDFCEFVLKHNKDEYIKINFFGGEPLLAFNVIKEVVNFFKDKGITDINYYITTNGTLINDEIADFLSANRFSVSISIDGDEEVHNKNRIYHNNKGSFKDVIKGLNLLKQYNCQNIRLRGTYNSESLPNLKNNSLFLHENFHETVVMVPDFFDTNWKEEDFSLLNEIYNYFKRFDDIYIIDEPACKPTLCGGGISNFYIDVLGDIYPCSYVVENEEYLIGNIAIGLNKNKIEELREINKRRLPQCENCSREFYCKSYKCKYLNLALTGNKLNASPVVCYIENILSSHHISEDGGI